MHNFVAQLYYLHFFFDKIRQVWYNFFRICAKNEKRLGAILQKTALPGGL